MSSERFNPRGSPERDDLRRERKRSRSPLARRRSRSKTRSRSKSGGNSRSSSRRGSTQVVKVRGLPYDLTPGEVIEFFDGCKVAGNKDGIFFTFDSKGQPNGEMYVELESSKDLERALKRHKQTLGER